MFLSFILNKFARQEKNWRQTAACDWSSGSHSRPSSETAVGLEAGYWRHRLIPAPILTSNVPEHFRDRYWSSFLALTCLKRFLGCYTKIFKSCNKVLPTLWQRFVFILLLFHWPAQWPQPNPSPLGWTGRPAASRSLPPPRASSYLPTSLLDLANAVVVEKESKSLQSGPKHYGGGFKFCCVKMLC